MISFKATSPVSRDSNSPSNRPFRETNPEETPISKRDIGLILSFAILPAPL